MNPSEKSLKKRTSVHCFKNECTLILQLKVPTTNSNKKVLWNAKFLAFHIVVILDLCRIPFDAVSFFFLSETDFLFKSASTPCEENSHIPIRTRPGITIQENLFLNGPTIQETYSQMGLLSRQTYSQMGLLSRQTYSQMGLLSRNVTPTRACTRVSGPTLENRT